MKSLSPLTDPVYTPRLNYSSYEKWWLTIISDKRDLPFIHLLTLIHLLVMLPGLLLFSGLFSGWLWWALVVPYLYFSQLYFKGRFGLMFHCMCHRKTFKKPYQWLDRYLTWVVCPFFGHAPEGYFSHHIGMHHMENNMPNDTSSTMGYQRDSIQSFMKYFFTFLIRGIHDTLAYLHVRKRKRMHRRLKWGECVYGLLWIGLCFIHLKATVVLLILPLFFSRLASMTGNWTQHAFVDPVDPENAYTNSINCINTVYNRACWNDGYHIIHHLRPGLHYTELPGEFLKLKEAISRNRAFVFDGIHYLHIFRYLMTKRYDKLADNLVNINSMFTSSQEAIELMRARTKKFMI